ncbi:BBE domain-containing protein [Paeniglutamicibacter gangotriensis]|uniref:FAD-dependent oxidoreductase n=1 Tax=Paeniglutamicibacter gangotriensis Lz1y TaxID=1276920 RepID=M7MQ34_9MICC|nr:BBE domain-containing protein [Paeniglutamicibacter gangotriensis]EMQ97045.1 FAD-dependent oxidoreductase [Paeniglutamicibacter gangotriensis Lz1y]
MADARRSDGEERWGCCATAGRRHAPAEAGYWYSPEVRAWAKRTWPRRWGDLVGSTGAVVARAGCVDLVGSIPLAPVAAWLRSREIATEISDAAIEVHARFGATLPTGHSSLHLYPIDGAAARVPPDATAFAYRDGGWAGVIVGVDPDPANAELITDWTKSYHDQLHPTTAGGAYVNFMMDEGNDRIRASYLHNYERLARIKAQYDPANLFSHNQNIVPAAVS